MTRSRGPQHGVYGRIVACVAMWALVFSAGCFEDNSTASSVTQSPGLVQSIEEQTKGLQEETHERQQIEAISTEDQAALEEAVGKSVIVEGHVVSARSSKAGHEFLNFANNEFYVFCPKDSLPGFGEQNPAKAFAKKRIQVAGKIERFSGKLQIRITSPDQIRIASDNRTASASDDSSTEESIPTFELRSIGKDAWLSPAGLEYRGRDPEGLTRLEHVKRHFQDQPDRDGPHGVFDADGNSAFALIDEAWTRIQTEDIEPKRQGQREAYEVDMGRRVGYLGGSVGKARGNPPLRRILVVVAADTKRIITVYPK